MNAIIGLIYLSQIYYIESYYNHYAESLPLRYMNYRKVAERLAESYVKNKIQFPTVYNEK